MKFLYYFSILIIFFVSAQKLNAEKNSLQRAIEDCEYTPKPFVYRPGNKLYSPSNWSIQQTDAVDCKIYTDIQRVKYNRISEWNSWDPEFGDFTLHAKFYLQGTSSVILCFLVFDTPEIGGGILSITTPQGQILDYIDASLSGAGINLQQFIIDDADNIHVYTFIPEGAQSFPIEYCAVPPFKTFKGKVKEAVYTISGNRFILKEITYSETKYFTCKRKFKELPNLWDL